jgi:hypothetical protein
VAAGDPAPCSKVEEQLRSLRSELGQDGQALRTALENEKEDPPSTRKQVFEIWKEVADKSWPEEVLDALIMEEVVGWLGGEDTPAAPVHAVGWTTVGMALLNLIAFLLKRTKDDSRWRKILSWGLVLVVCAYVLAVAKLALDVGGPSGSKAETSEEQKDTRKEPLDGAQPPPAVSAPNAEIPVDIRPELKKELGGLSTELTKKVEDEGRKTREELGDLWLWWLPVWLGAIAAMLTFGLHLRRGRLGADPPHASLRP